MGAKTRGPHENSFEIGFDGVPISTSAQWGQCGQSPISEVLRLAKRKNSIYQMIRAPARTSSQREKGATDYKLTDAIFSKLR